MTNIGRRYLLAAAAVAPLAACVPQPEPAPSPRPTAQTTTPTPTTAAPTPTPEPTPTLPFGLEEPSRVQALIFDGAFGVSYVRSAADALREAHDGVRVIVRSSTSISDDVASTFDGGTPPDLIDNTGAGSIPLADIAADLLELDDLLAAENLEGDIVGETLYSGVAEAGTFNGRLVALNYALSVYGLWHSASDFAAQGWSVPVAWDELLLLGEDARANGQYLFTWGDDAAYYYAELAIASAIKEGGHDVRRALDSLAADGWAHPAVAGVLQALEQCVAEGFVLNDGTYLEAQDGWSMERRALFYPSGSWIAKEMATRTAEGFEMTVSPVPTLTAAPTLPINAVHAQPTEQFIVPRAAENPAGGQELLRIMVSREVAEEFARTNLVPTVVRGSTPTDLESTALAAQTRMLADAGEDVFSWRYVHHYGLREGYNRLWGEFLHGQLGAASLAEQLQALSDEVREDPEVRKYTVD